MVLGFKVYGLKVLKEKIDWKLEEKVDNRRQKCKIEGKSRK